VKKVILFLYCGLFALSSFATTPPKRLHTFPLQALLKQTLTTHSPSYPATPNHYTVLDDHHYHETVTNSRAKVTHILSVLNRKPATDANAKLALIASQLIDIPYLHQNGMGEGDWQPKSMVYLPNAIHLKQHPVYRLDGLNCQTLVQVAMAFYLSNRLSSFDQHYLKIAYGAAHNPLGEIVHYYNRNHFIDADFNPVNQKHGWLSDVTTASPYARKIHANVTRQQWFLRQRYHLTDNIQVLKDSSGPLMLNRFKTIYTALPFPHFDHEDITISYLPKEILALRQEDDTFKPNQPLLNKIPTPAIVEIIRDPEIWNDYGIKIKNILGTEETVSHLGLLYRQTFKRGALIYQKIACNVDNTRKKNCEVTPIFCQKKICKELMFTHATNAYPKKYYWYLSSEGKYVCSSHLPESGTAYTSCNRVVSLPFYDYLTDYQLGYYWNMDVTSILGVHVEKLNSKMT